MSALTMKNTHKHIHFLPIFLTIFFPAVIFLSAYLFLFPSKTKKNSSDVNRITETVVENGAVEGNGGENGVLEKEEKPEENSREEKETENEQEEEAEVGHYAKSGELEDLIWKIIEKTK